MESQYQYQCLMGHVGDITAGTELEKRAQVRESKGKLDAICLHSSECPDCLEDQRIRDRGWRMPDMDWT